VRGAWQEGSTPDPALPPAHLIADSSLFRPFPTTPSPAPAPDALQVPRPHHRHHRLRPRRQLAQHEGHVLVALRQQRPDQAGELLRQSGGQGRVGTGEGGALPAAARRQGGA
jgi:hypothetical protein